MSGYLQRIVSNARTPARAIHPILGPLFSATQSAEPFVAEESLLVSPRPDPVVEPAAGAPPPPELGRLPIRETARAADSKPPHQLPMRSREPNEKPATALLLPGLPDKPDENSLKHSEPYSPEPEREIAIDYSFTPLIEEGDRPAVPVRIPGMPGEPRASLPRRSPPPEPERDEIEIHIGRIEVTAVPQAVARPAAQPARKSLNLDEYLKRRNRRA